MLPRTALWALALALPLEVHAQPPAANVARRDSVEPFDLTTGESKTDAKGLAHYMRLASSHARRVMQARAESEAAAAGPTETLGRLLPQLSLRAAYTRNQFEARGLRVEEGTGATSTVVLLPRDQWDLDASATVPLLDLHRWYDHASARATWVAARNRLEVVQADVLLEVARFYLAAVAAQQKLRSATRALEAARADVRYVEARRTIGGATSLTLARANLEEQRARQRLIEQRRVLLEQLRQLGTLCGTGQPHAVAPVLVDLTPPAPADYRRVTLRPELRDARARRRSAEAAARASYWKLAPALQAIASEHFGNTPGFAGRRGWYTLLLQLRLDVDLSRLGRARQASAHARAERARFSHTKDVLQDQLYLARLAVITGIETVRTAREAERVAIRAAEAARAQFRLGSGTQRDVIEGERDRVSAEAERAEAEAKLALERLALRRARGQSLLEWPRRSSGAKDG
jgi:outer membrane protein TolC